MTLEAQIAFKIAVCLLPGKREQSVRIIDFSKLADALTAESKLGAEQLNELAGLISAGIAFEKTKF